MFSKALPRGDDEMVGEEEALPDCLPLLPHDAGQPASGPRLLLLRQNLHDREISGGMMADVGMCIALVLD